VLRDEDARDDLIAVQTAILRETNSSRWVLQAGPLPMEPALRTSYYEVAERGLDELTRYLGLQGL
jgi:hypothetical protein